MCNAAKRVRKRGSLRRPDTKGRRDVSSFEVSGTWDFKWPLESEIRIAFQRPSSDSTSNEDFEAAMGIVKDHMQLWTSHIANLLKVEFLDLVLDPPLGEENSLTDQHRSPFAPADPRQRPYDVLISLQHLPVTIVDPFQGVQSLLTRIQFPDADVGTYARRADFGAPTVYLGPHAGWPEEHGSVSAFLKSPIGQHMVVHELGHVLGLPHMHQHPDLLEVAKGRTTEETREEHYKPISDIQRIFSKLYGDLPDKKMIEGNVIAPWPGNVSFSDWLPFSEAERDAYAKERRLDSIMTHPYYACLVKGGPDDLDNVPLPTKPGKRDYEMLRFMYDPNFKHGSASAASSKATHAKPK